MISSVKLLPMPRNPVGRLGTRPLVWHLKPLVVVLSLLVPTAASAQARGALPPWASDVVDVMRQARKLQTPYTALRVWGDPVETHGAASPELVYSLRPGTRYNVYWMWVDLVYGPEVEAPNRLRRLIISLSRDVGPITEKTVTMWLGIPTRKTMDEYLGLCLDYDGRDAAKLGVLSACLPSQKQNFSSGLRVELLPR